MFKTRPHSYRPSSLSASDLTTQALHVNVASRGSFFLLPEFVTCFKDAQYNQSQKFQFHEDSTVVVLDWITSGRLSLGEQWSFTRYRSTNEFWMSGKRVAKDVLLLDDSQSNLPPLGPRSLESRLYPYSCFATLFLFGSDVQNIVNSLNNDLANVSQFQSPSPTDLIWSLSSCGGHGTVVRLAATEAQMIRLWLRTALGPLKDVIGIDIFEKAFI